MTILSARILTANFVDYADDTIKTSYPVHEFQNGLILVPYEGTNDGFFKNRMEIQGCGNDSLEFVQDKGEITDYSFDELVNACKGAIQEFGAECIPCQVFELLTKTALEQNNIVDLLNLYMKVNGDNIWQDVIYDLPNVDVAKCESYDSNRVCFTNGLPDIVYNESTKEWE